jgi:menaquinone-dependent protoporphyrinogen IX oxidase
MAARPLRRKILVAYATTDGQTRKIADFIGARIAALGGEPTLLDLGEHGRANLAGSMR